MQLLRTTVRVFGVFLAVPAFALQESKPLLRWHSPAWKISQPVTLYQGRGGDLDWLELMALSDATRNRVVIARTHKGRCTRLSHVPFFLRSPTSLVLALSDFIFKYDTGGREMVFDFDEGTDGDVRLRIRRRDEDSPFVASLTLLAPHHTVIDIPIATLTLLDPALREAFWLPPKIPKCGDFLSEQAAL